MTTEKELREALSEAMEEWVRRGDQLSTQNVIMRYQDLVATLTRQLSEAHEAVRTSSELTAEALSLARAEGRREVVEWCEENRFLMWTATGEPMPELDYIRIAAVKAKFGGAA